MDPALEQILETRAGAETVSVFARLLAGVAPPRGLAVAARFGDVVTGRVKVGDIRRLHGTVEVVSLKAARPVAASREAGGTFRPPPGAPAATAWTPSPLEVGAGRGCLLATIDFGWDPSDVVVAGRDGRFRMEASWDQRPVGSAAGGRPGPHGYGRVYRGVELQGLRGAAVGDHGADVLHIAATMAPASPLAHVHLHADDIHGHGSLGNSVRVAEALDFVRSQAGGRPWVANLSIGSNGGPRDGSTLLEAAIDALHAEDDSCCVVCSAGNYGGAGLQWHGAVSQDESVEVPIEVSGPSGGLELEVWYDGSDEFEVTLAHPASGIEVSPALGSCGQAAGPTGPLLTVHHRRCDPGNGDHHVDAFFGDGAPQGSWVLRVHGKEVRDGRVHAWLERGAEGKAAFTEPDPSSASSLGTLAACRGALIVGAASGSGPFEVPPFGSRGPTRDGRHKPDLLANGADVAIRRGDRHRVVAGASFAAPQVSAAMAALLGRGATRVHAIDALRGTGRPVEGTTAVAVRPSVALRQLETMTTKSEAAHETTGADPWDELQRTGVSRDFERLAAPGCRPPQEMGPMAWVLERGPGPRVLVHSYPLSECGASGPEGVLDGEGRVRPGRMLVRPRLGFAAGPWEAGTIDPANVSFLAFEGGGAKGRVYPGAIRALEARGVLRRDSSGRQVGVRGVAGASAGAMAALMVALGMTAREMESELDGTPAGTFFDGPHPGRTIRLASAPRASEAVRWSAGAEARLLSPSRLLSTMADSVGVALKAAWRDGPGPPLDRIIRDLDGTIAALRSDQGIFDGWAARQEFARIIGRELARISGGDARVLSEADFETFKGITGVDLVAVGHNIASQKSELFSARTSPKLHVADAIRVSIAFPLLYKPVIVDATDAARFSRRGDPIGPAELEGKWVDGGLGDNLPMTSFDARPAEVLGLALGDGTVRSHDGLIGYLWDLARSLVDAGGAFNSASRRRGQVITLDTGSLSLLDMNQKDEEVRRLRSAAEETVLARVSEVP